MFVGDQLEKERQAGKSGSVSLVVGARTHPSNLPCLPQTWRPILRRLARQANRQAPPTVPRHAVAFTAPYTGKDSQKYASVSACIPHAVSRDMHATTTMPTWRDAQPY